MKLTCVTATFNCIKAGNQERLIRCVESVAKLKTEHEHLIYDGASTDGTVELLRELEAKTPELKVVSERDTGIYNALNKGVRDAKGEWFYVLGADDYIAHPEVMDRLIATVDSKTDVVVTSVERDGKVMIWFTVENIDRTLISMPHCHQGIIMKSGVCRSLGGFNEQFRICADYDLLLKAHKAGLQFAYSYEPFAEFSFGGESSVSDDDLKADFSRCRAQFLHLSEMERYKYDKYGFPSMIKLCPYFFHRDLALRCSARMLLKRWVLYYFHPIVKPILYLKHKVLGFIERTTRH